MSRPVVVLTGPWRPHELLLQLVGIVSTVGYIAGGPAPGSITTTLPGWAVTAFYVLFGTGSTFGLVGCLMRQRALGPGLNQGGLLIQAAALVLYAVAILAYAGHRGWGVILILAGWTSANIWRAVQIQNALRARAAPR